jgi:hypothetical protein
MRLILSVVLLLSFPAFAAHSIFLKSGMGGHFYNIDSFALVVTPPAGGVEIHPDLNGPSCNVTNDYLKMTNTSGLELLRTLADPKFDYVVECQATQRADAPTGFLATKIRTNDRSD